MYDIQLLWLYGKWKKEKNLFGIFLCFTAIADSLFLRYITCLSSFYIKCNFSKMFIDAVFIWYNYVENQAPSICIGPCAIRRRPHVSSIVTP